MKKNKVQREYEKKFNRIVQKLHGNQANKPQKEEEKRLTTQQKVTKDQRNGINNDVLQKSNTNKKSQVSNEVPKEIATKVSKERNVPKLTLKQYLSQEEKNRDENTKTKTEKIEVYDNEKEKENKIVESQERVEKKDPEQKEEEVDEKEKRKDIFDKIIQYLENDTIKDRSSDEDDDIISSLLDWDPMKEAALYMYNENKLLINSSEFKYIGNLHQQLINGVENGNSIFNRFEIDNNILNNYKQYYEQIINFINTFIIKTPIEFIQDDFSFRLEQIEKIITDIYTKLYGSNGLKNFQEILCVLIKENINSEEKLKGNNILKILAHLAIAINYCILNLYYAILQLIFGKNNDFFKEALNHCKTIYDVFGIKSPKKFRN